MRSYVPVKLDLNIYPAKYRPWVVYFLALVHRRRYKADSNGYVHLKYEYLRKVIPRKLWRDLRAMLEGDRACYPTVVEEDMKTVRGVKATGYRLATEYRKVHEVEWRDKKLARKGEQLRKKEEAALLPVHRWLKQKLALLTFDLDRAVRIVAKMKPKTGSKQSVEEFRCQQTSNCEQLASGEHYLTCDSYGRVHTLLTSLPKKLRGCLSVKGQPLVGWDLANSQPLIAGLLARKFHGSPDAADRLCKKEFDGKGNPYILKGLADVANWDRVPEDVEDYIVCCELGTFYESFGSDRERSKKVMIRTVLFGKNKYTGPIKDDFEKQYPSVGDMLRRLKRKTHARAARLLQNMESTIFIYRICRHIMTEGPELPLFTVHDCLFTVPDGLDYVRTVIEEEFRDLGVSPKLKRTEGYNR